MRFIQIPHSVSTDVDSRLLSLAGASFPSCNRTGIFFSNRHGIPDEFRSCSALTRSQREKLMTNRALYIVSKSKGKVHRINILDIYHKELSLFRDRLFEYSDTCIHMLSWVNN